MASQATGVFEARLRFYSIYPNHERDIVFNLSVTNRPRFRQTARSERGRCSLLPVPALAETWRARDARLTLSTGVHRTKVSEMRQPGASATDRSQALRPLSERSGVAWRSRYSG